jgi:hypothetical protein
MIMMKHDLIYRLRRLAKFTREGRETDSQERIADLLEEAAEALDGQRINIAMAAILQNEGEHDLLACPQCGFVVGALQKNHKNNG